MDSVGSPLEQLLGERRLDAALRRETLGPLFEAAGQLRASCALIRAALDELESTVGVHLELLDAVLRAYHGNRWWDALSQDRDKGGALP